jgi:co-chaperonin GroES (HSP10)
MNNGGDVLARGCPTAQFAGASSEITSFENDVIYMEVADVLEKYGLSQAEYDQYTFLRSDGQKLPDLTPVALQETLEVGFSISDHRKNYLSESTEAAAVQAEAPKKYPEPSYEPMQTLMDRVLVMVVSDDPNIELLEDGSSRNKRTGLISTAKYRQHSNVGIVLLAGQWVVVGGVKTPMHEVVRPGDKVIYGDYGSEKMDDTFNKKAEAICDAIGVNFEKTEQGIRIVRIQDVRTVEKKVAPLASFQAFVTGIYVPPTTVTLPNLNTGGEPCRNS